MTTQVLNLTSIEFLFTHSSASLSVSLSFLLFAAKVPKLVDQVMAGKLKIDPYITHRLPIEDINKAFDLMHEGNCLRVVMNF